MAKTKKPPTRTETPNSTASGGAPAPVVRRGITLHLTREMIEEAADIVGRGNFRQTARGLLGVPPGTWASWLARGRKEIQDLAAGKIKDVTLKAELVDALDVAECRAHSSLLADVVGEGDPRVKVDFLRRRYNKLYSANPNAHTDDETGETFKVDPLELLQSRLAVFFTDGAQDNPGETGEETDQ